MHIEGSPVITQNIVFLYKTNLVFASSVGRDEILHYASFHLGLHCLPKNRFRDFQSAKGSKT